MILIIDCGSKKSPEIVKKVNDSGYRAKMVRQETFDPVCLQDTMGVIVSGAPILITEVNPLPYLERFAWIKTYEKPVLGICFGHQIIGLLHGAEAKKCEACRTDQSVRVLDAHGLFQNFQSPVITVNQDHCEEITLPEGFIHTATSDTCRVEGMRHPRKPVFGIQFHPETSGDTGKRILDNFCKTCTALS